MFYEDEFALDTLRFSLPVLALFAGLAWALLRKRRGGYKTLIWSLLTAFIAFPYAGLGLIQDFVKGQIDKGMERSKSGDFQGALVHFNRTVTVTPHLAWAYRLRAQTKVNMGDLKGALGDLIQLTQLVPDYAWAYMLRAQVKGTL